MSGGLLSRPLEVKPEEVALHAHLELSSGISIDLFNVQGKADANTESANLLFRLPESPFHSFWSLWGLLANQSETQIEKLLRGCKCFQANTGLGRTLLWGSLLCLSVHDSCPCICSEVAKHKRLAFFTGVSTIATWC